MFNPVRKAVWAGTLVLGAASLVASTASQSQSPQRDEVLAAMKRATTFMVEKVSTRGGYVWAYLPDLSRRWGELEARDTQIWIQPPGTPTMGHLFLDAYHATGDEYYYQAAEQVAGALIWGQHPSGGWNYLVDFGGEGSIRDWYDTIGKNAWRMEEFQHYWGNATFDDAGTAEASKFLLRLYVEKRDPKYKPALDKTVAFVLDSQYPIGAWPQRYPLMAEFTHHGKPDYTSYPTFNDDVAGENIDFLLKAYQALGDRRLLDAITRGMNAFLVTQQAPPQPGWALQYTPDLKPVGARTYEPDALTTHTSARNVELLIEFYQLTGDTKFLARAPEAIDWLEKLALPPARSAGGPHPSDVHRAGHEPAALRAPGGIERGQRPLLRRLRLQEHAGALQRVPSGQRRGSEAPAQRGQSLISGGAGESLAARDRSRPRATAALLRGGRQGEGHGRECDREPQRVRLLDWRRSATTAIRTRATARRRPLPATIRAPTSATRPIRRRTRIRSSRAFPSRPTSAT